MGLNFSQISGLLKLCKPPAFKQQELLLYLYHNDRRAYKQVLNGFYIFTLSIKNILLTPLELLQSASWLAMSSSNAPSIQLWTNAPAHHFVGKVPFEEKRDIAKLNFN